MTPLKPEEQRRYDWYVGFVRHFSIPARSINEWLSFFHQVNPSISGVHDLADQYIAPEPLANPKLVSLMSLMLDKYAASNRSLSELTEDFDIVLRRQALATGFEAALDRAALVAQMGDALDQEALTKQLSSMLDARMMTPAFTEAMDDQALPKRFETAIDEQAGGNGKWHPKNCFEKQMYDVLCKQFGCDQYAADGGPSITLGTEPDRYPEQADYALNPEALNDLEHPDQYAGPFNPIAHPRGNVGNSGQFTKKVGPDPDMLGMADEGGGPGGGGGQEPPMPVVPPLPPAKASVARVDLPDQINNKIQQIAHHIPDYLLDGEGRTKDAHITIKMLADDDPKVIVEALADEAPFRAVLGKITITDANESRPFDIVKIDIHSPVILRIHKKLSKMLDGMHATNGYSPYIRIADTQPGTADRLLGWDGLEGESVVVDSLTFVNRKHEAHKIPLKGKEGEYQLDTPEQYAASKQLSMFDAPTQSQPRAQEVKPPTRQEGLGKWGVTNKEVQGSMWEPIPTPRSSTPALASPRADSPRTDTSPTQAPSLIQGSTGTDIRQTIPEQATPTQPKEPQSESTGIDTTPTPGYSEDPTDTEYEPQFDDPGRPDDERPDSPGTPGTLGSRSLVTAREDITPKLTEADTSLVPEGIKQFLRPHQIEDSAMAIKAMEAHGGFLNASGTGSGKSYSTLAVAKYWADKGYKVAIVTPNEVINPNYTSGFYSGTFRKAGKALGVAPVLNGGQGKINPGEIHITTYHHFHDLEPQVDGNTVMLYDESHLMKNQDAARSQAGDRINRKAKAVMYATATPADKPMHIAHLFRAKVFGNRPPEATFEELGLQKYQEKAADGKLVDKWRIHPDIGPIEVYRRINGLFDKMTEEGLMVKRDLSYDGLHVDLRKVELPSDAHETLKAIEHEVTGGMGLHSLQGLEKGRLLMDLRRQQEPYKVDIVADLVKDELHHDPTRQVIIFTQRVNPSDVKREENIIHSSKGTPELLKNAFYGHPGIRIGELHGGSSMPAAMATSHFQQGTHNVLIATPHKGGMGIDLDDQKGNRPRTMIIMTADFGGDKNLQLIGRVWRDRTIADPGKTRILYLFANTEIDDWNQIITANKMKTLGAVVSGETRHLEIPFEVGEEGVQDLVRANKTEREKHRDRVSAEIAKERYRWRSLTAAAQEAIQEHQSAIEGIEPTGTQTRSKSNVEYKPKGKPTYKKQAPSLVGQQALFTQRGTPERYTMTAAEIDEAVKSWKPPTEAQHAAENYHKPKIRWHGLLISIENPRGTRRKPEWKPLAHHYGYINRTEGRDGDHVDAYMGLYPESDIVFVVDQEHPSGYFDEHKCILGARNQAEARKFYLDNYQDGWHCGPITAMTIDQFKAWLEHGDTTTRVADQVSKYAAKFTFSELHPRHEQNKRFVAKHPSLTLAQTIDRAPTPGERKTYAEYVDFLKVGRTKPMPFKDWLKFHRTTKFYQAQKEREDVAKTSPGGRDSEGPGENDTTAPEPDQCMEGRRREGPRDSGAMGPGGKTEQLIGGEGDNRPESDFDSGELAKGIEVESEHTDNRAMAEEIARDHLSENPTYYTKLETMEADDAVPDESETPVQDEAQDTDSEQEGREDSSAGEYTRPSRSTGNPARHSIKALRDFAASVYTGYYQDAGEPKT